MKKILSYLGIEAFGWYELMFAMYLILAGYHYGSIPMSALMLVIMAGIAFLRGARPTYKPHIIGYVFAYIIIHDVFLWFILPSHPSYVISNVIVNVVTYFALFIILSKLDCRKSISMIYLVSVVSLLGLYYHVALIQRGVMVEPIRLPFMPEMSTSSRAFEEGLRPKSFFWEPAACVTFLMVPFYISVIKKRWIWVAVLMFSMFISTSSNGIILSTLILCVYIILGSAKMRYKLLTALLALGMLYLFISTDVFEFGREKLENTEVEGNARLSNGPLLVMRTNPSYLILGVPNANAYDYIKDNNISIKGMQIDDESIFVPTFWALLLNYGVIGLFLYFAIFWSLVKMDKRLIPYIAALIVATFVQSILVGANFVFQTICMLIIAKNKNIR
jgi:hypothetical protein